VLKPKLSVITVVRNGMPFVEATLDSVLGQHYPALEYIVIDGGSTDGTVEVIKAHQAGISQWLSEPDDGISDAFNKGLALATGDYILFLNADDALAAPDVLAKMAEKIVEHQFPSMIYGDCDLLERDTGQLLCHTVVAFSHKGLRRGQMPPHPALLTQRGYFDQYGGFDTGFKLAMDYEWLLRGGFKQRIIHIPMLMTKVRDGGVSARDQVHAVDEIVLALKKNRVINPLWGEFALRGYFFIRAFARKLLSAIGLYALFSTLRIRLRRACSRQANGIPTIPGDNRP
jgi:glycosyltransferase